MPGNLTSLLEERVAGALKVAYDYGALEQAHHKQWIIDQMVRALTGGDYENWVKKFNFGLDGEDSQLWDGGWAP